VLRKIHFWKFNFHSAAVSSLTKSCLSIESQAGQAAGHTSASEPPDCLPFQRQMISHLAGPHWLGFWSLTERRGAPWVIVFYREHYHSTQWQSGERERGPAGRRRFFTCPGNGETTSYGEREYMTWLSEALSPIWKPNCGALEQKETATDFQYYFYSMCFLL
jgi:hypothetical protein